MNISVYLDGNLLKDQPKGIEDIEEVIKRDDDEIGGVFISYDGELEFWGDGFRYIYDKFKQNGFCWIINLQIIDNDNNRELRGLIRISSCVFDLQKYVVKCPIDDNNFGAYIFNNKNIKAKLDVGKSKNGVPIQPAAVQSWTLFNPQAQTASSNRYGVTYYEAMKFLVAFMSDGKIKFKSDFLQYGVSQFNNIIGSQLVLMKGLEIRIYLNNDESIVTTSFKDAFDNLRKLFPVLFGIEIDSNGDIYLRIEKEEHFANTQNSLVIDYQDDLILSFDTYKLYSNIKIGSGKVANYKQNANPQIHSFAPIRFIQFQKEEYQLQGLCNIDKAKDLELTYITDHNIIEELVESNTTNSSYDNDIFIIECFQDAPGLREAVAYTLPGIVNAKLYNIGLSNRRVIERFGFAGSLAFYEANVDASFKAERPTEDIFYAVSRYSVNAQPNEAPYVIFSSGSPPIPIPLQKIQYPNEIYDNSNSYNNTLYEFVVPATGYYTFEVRQTFLMAANAYYLGYNQLGQLSNNPATVKNVLLLAVLDSLNNLLFEFKNIEIYDNNIQGEDLKTQTINQSIYLTAGQKVVVYVKAFIKPKNPVTENLNNNTTGYEEDVMQIKEGTFECTASLTGGGVYRNEDSQNQYLVNLQFNNLTTQNQWDNIKFGVTKAILVNRDGNVNYTCWVKELRRNWITTATEFRTISNIKNIK